MNTTFNHSDILKVFPGIKARTLISWSERGLIRPLQKASGRGSSRVYSYTNLIEIAILNELLQYGIPFAHIMLVMRGKEMRGLLKDEQWDSIFWISREETLGLPRLYPVMSYGVMPFNEFLDKGGRMIMAPKGMPITDKRSGKVIKTLPIDFCSSAIVINIKTLRQHVDYMINKV